VAIGCFTSCAEYVLTVEDEADGDAAPPKNEEPVDWCVGEAGDLLSGLLVVVVPAAGEVAVSLAARRKCGGSELSFRLSLGAAADDEEGAGAGLAVGDTMLGFAGPAAPSDSDTARSQTLTELQIE
jgi:hypothetical protein